uniref:Uncharacterized protein n=2 Tax=Cacopsylla melanoneura TaxID=428564 RepID=A0A8D9B653_9HEMI
MFFLKLCLFGFLLAGCTLCVVNKNEKIKVDPLTGERQTRQSDNSEVLRFPDDSDTQNYAPESGPQFVSKDPLEGGSQIHLPRQAPRLKTSPSMVLIPLTIVAVDSIRMVPSRAAIVRQSEDTALATNHRRVAFKGIHNNNLNNHLLMENQIHDLNSITRTTTNPITTPFNVNPSNPLLKEAMKDISHPLFRPGHIFSLLQTNQTHTSTIQMLLIDHIINLWYLLGHLINRYLMDHLTSEPLTYNQINKHLMVNLINQHLVYNQHLMVPPINQHPIIQINKRPIPHQINHLPMVLTINQQLITHQPTTPIHPTDQLPSKIQTI